MTTLKMRLARGELVLCMGLRQARTPDIPMVAAAAGFDAVYVDMEHSPVSYETTSVLCIGARAAGISALVRPPGHDPIAASRVLDGGAAGVIFPGIDTPEQARDAAAACRFAPAGKRGVSGSGPSLGYRALPLAEVNAQGDAETLVVVMIETPLGVENAAAIAAVAGVDVLLIGSNDLCTELGIPGQLRHPALRDAYARVAAACAAHGKTLGIGGIRGDAELQQDLITLGGRFVIAGNDVGYLGAAARRDAETLRAMAPASHASGT
jgi:2-keto-3-deoxy-L-rhamnonate aldolase RhmA